MKTTNIDSILIEIEHHKGVIEELQVALDKLHFENKERMRIWDEKELTMSVRSP